MAEEKEEFEKEELKEGEEKEERGENSYAKSTLFTTDFLAIIGKTIMLDFLSSKPNYSVILFLWWIVIAGLLYFATFNIKSSQTIFTIYCCNVWIVLLAILFLFTVKRIDAPK
jgi:pheromone shutdown protein TraB